MEIQHIIPAIIPDSLDHLQSRLREVSGVVSRVQIDVMNGTYAPTVSWPYGNIDRDTFESLRREDKGLPYWQEFDFEIDLMVAKPEERIEEWTLAGATCLIIHVESTEKLAEIFTKCQELHVEVALALKPSTDIALLAPYVQQAVFVQCMGNNRIGYHGVNLDQHVHDTIRAIKKRWPALEVGVDIGVSKETIPTFIEAGATRFAAGSAVFNNIDPVGALHLLEKQAYDALRQTQL